MNFFLLKYCFKNKAKTEENKTCNTQYLKKAKRSIFMFGLICIFSFMLGYIIDPHQLRMIWLIISGTLAVCSGLAIYLLNYNVFVFGKNSDTDT